MRLRSTDDDAKGKQRQRERPELSLLGRLSEWDTVHLHPVTGRLDSVSTSNSKARDLHGAVVDPPADRARARAKGVTDWRLASLALFVSGRERERERDQRVGYVCAWPERALSLFPAKGPRPGRPPWTGTPVARPLPAMFVLEASKGARARPSSFPSQLHPPRTAAPSISIRILQHVRWIIARHCRWDLRIHGFGRSKVSRHRATPADLLGRRTLGGAARARQIWPIH